MNITELTEVLEKSICLNDDQVCLSLVSKNEGTIVNEVVKYMNQHSTELVAVKEYRRVDVALFDKEQLLAGTQVMTDLIEFKSCYSYDLQGAKGFMDYMKILDQDFNKVKNIELMNQHKHVQRYNVLIVTNPLHAIPDHYEGIVTYKDGINRVINDTLNSHEENGKKIRAYYDSEQYEVMDFKVENQDGANFLGMGADLSVYIIQIKN